MKAKTANLPVIMFEHKRDAYGFAVRPQHIQIYKEYANIYKEEEEERSDRWNGFLERRDDSAETPSSEFFMREETMNNKLECVFEEGANDGNKHKDGSTEDSSAKKETRVHMVQEWSPTRPSLGGIEQMMSCRVKKRDRSAGREQYTGRNHSRLASAEEGISSKGHTGEESEEEFYDVEKSDLNQEPTVDLGSDAIHHALSSELCFSWREELESLVHGGLPMALRGKLWQAFVGVKVRMMEGYYHELLAKESYTNEEHLAKGLKCSAEKWKGQIEKDLPRTFPGHPALDEDGRNALRRLLTAYARHNPSVGYCQAMNFFAGLLLLLMPEEDAFWTLLGIIDDYFDGYYSEEMIESQVDQLVFEELVHDKFPKLVNHLDYLGVQVAWVSGPWFLSIFVNMLPWESVLRVWDVLLFKENRVMLFWTALALMELYGPALVTTKDAGDAVTLLQSLAGSTFDSSQLVLTACMGYQAINEIKLEELREKHRPAVLEAMDERSKGFRACKDSKGLASKLYSFKHDPGSLLMETASKECLTDAHANGDAEKNLSEFVFGLTGNMEVDSIPDLKEQVVWLKVELCKLLEEKRSAILRAEELETALMEMVQQDNRRLLSAKIEELEQESHELREALSDKQEQERAMLQLLMRVEQEQKLTEDARVFAEQDASAERYAAQMLQEKYEEAMSLLSQMEKRAVMAETMLEATLQYQSSQVKEQQSQCPSPSTMQSTVDSTQDVPSRKTSLLSRPFGLGWRDRNKVTEVKSSSETGQSLNGPPLKDVNGNQEPEK